MESLLSESERSELDESDESGYSSSEKDNVSIDPDVDAREVKVTSSSSSVVAWSCSCRMSSQMAASSAQASTAGESVVELSLDPGSESESGSRP